MVRTCRIIILSSGKSCRSSQGILQHAQVIGDRGISVLCVESKIRLYNLIDSYKSTDIGHSGLVFKVTVITLSPCQMACRRVIIALCGLEVGPHPLIHMLEPNNQDGIIKGKDLGSGKFGRLWIILEHRLAHSLTRFNPLAAT